MIVAVFDATTLLQAATNRRGPAGCCFVFACEGRVRLVLSEITLAEIRELLSRPSVRAKFAKLTDEKVSRFLDELIAASQYHEDVPTVRRLPRDPDDEPYLNLAIASNAAFIVSRDKDLLDLMDDAEFRQSQPMLSIVDPVAFLNHVRAEIARDLGYE